MDVRKLKKKVEWVFKLKSQNGSPHQSTSSLPHLSSPTDNPVTRPESSAGGTLSPLAQIIQPASAPLEASPTIAQPASLLEPGPTTTSSLPSPAPKLTSTSADPTPIVTDNGPRQSADSPGSDPNAPVSSPHPPPQSTSNRESLKLRSNITDGAWNSLTAFVRVVSKGASLFGPLKEAIDVFANFVEATDAAIAGQPGYDTVKAELGALFTDMIKLFPKNSPPTMTNSMKSLCGAIRNEVKLISIRQEGSIRRLDEARDLNDVLDCYKRIQGHLERFKMNVDLSIWKTLDDHITETKLSKIPRAPAAGYNSTQASTVGRRECTPDTREQVLSDLKAWRMNKEAGKIFYLNGMAGTGKTTISNTLCASLDGEHGLGASFFCTRQLPECRKADIIFPSIAYQLARFSHPFRAALSQALEEDPDAHTLTLRAQFERMILGPLHKVEASFPANVVVVIDALDECEDVGGVGQILQVLLEHGSNQPIKYFVSSRPETEIRRWIGEMESQLILHELGKEIVEEDIERYLRAELKSMSLSENQLSTLVRRAGVLFIYAATVARYLNPDDPSVLSEERLEDILGLQSEATTGQYDQVDTLYGTILASAFNKPTLKPRDKDRVRLILDTVVCAQEPLTVDALAGLLKLKDARVVRVALEPLWSILHISKSGLVSTLHASFPDYMLDTSRSETHGCNAQIHHQKLTGLCFDRIKRNERQFNVCELESSYIFDDDVPDLAERVKKAIPLDLSYACQYWAVHLELGGAWSEVAKPLVEFLSERVLLWMEVLNLKKRIGDTGISLDKTRRWCIKAGCSAEIKALVQDAWRFVMMFATNVVSRCTPHIYVSMLSSWPRWEAMSQYYMERTKGLVEVKGSRMARRNLALLSIFDVGTAVLSVAFSPDGTRIISGSSDKTIRVWDGQTGKMVLDPLQGHTESVNSVAFSPNGTRIVSGSSDKTIRVWDGQTGKLVFDPLQGHTSLVYSVAFSPNGTRIVSGSEDKTIRVWDGQTGKMVLDPLQGHTSSVESVAFSPDGTRIVSGSSDNTIQVWDGQTGKALLDPLQGHTESVNSVAFSPDGTQIISGSSDNTIRVWDGQTGKMVLNPLQGHTGSAYLVAFSPGGTRIVSGSSDNTIRVWDGQTGKILLDSLQGHTSFVNSVAFSPDGTRIVSGSSDKTMRVWDGQTGKMMLDPPQGHTELAKSVLFSPNSTRVVSGSYDKTIEVWNGQAGKTVLGPLQGHTSSVYLVAFSPDGTQIVSGSSDDTIRVWDGQTGKMLLNPLQGHTESVNSVAFSPDGTQIISGSSDDTIRVWDGRAGKMMLDPLQGHTNSVFSVAFSPDGTRIVSGSRDKTIRVWDGQTGKMVLDPLQGHTNSVFSVAFSPDGTQIVSGSSDKTIRVWDGQTGKTLLNPLQGHTDLVNSVAFSPDGTRIVSGSSDKTIRVWDGQTGKALLDPLQGHTESVNSVAFSPDGTQIISGSSDNTIRVWDGQTGKMLLDPLQGHTSLVYSVAFSPDGARIVSGSSDKTIRVWQARSPHPTQNLVQDHSNLSHPTRHSWVPNPIHRTPSWVLNSDGWAVDGQSHLLWVPHDLHDTLLRYSNSLVISTSGSAELDFSNANIGKSWVQCYSPA
ncbi:Lissencephaly-1 [Ceratobasidium theobromae]|uniref:Lissencephaly-1 n=1 Tax=Ceratobasidium theobromae TaxID=1582974 RepID=A0A5N5QJF0_9AGAM|nr:Lissencephaly-1 [Ceratobasidium theobromae]